MQRKRERERYWMRREGLLCIALGMKTSLRLGRRRSFLSAERTERQRGVEKSIRVDMKELERTGVLVVGHGSRRQEANDDLREVAQKIAVRGVFELVEPAFLEIEQPDVAAGFRRLIERGACRVTVHPYFLSPGRHTRGDLPRQVGEVAASFPGVSYEIS